jgi:tRNA 2-thiouridine synthesizing protein A
VSAYVLDATGTLCPIPVIRVQDRLAELSPGDVLTVHASDPGATHDIPAWCRVHGHTVQACEEGEDGVRVVIEVGHG